MEKEHAVVARALGVAVFLERFTTFALEDFHILEESLNKWPKAVTGSPSFNKFPLFSRAKYLSVKYVLNGVVESFLANSISEVSGALGIPVNILEAVISDFVEHNPDNAKAGAVLAWNHPGHFTTNAATGEGPTELIGTGNNRSFAYHYPLAQQWSDLYSVWNVDFVMHEFTDWPITIPKLLIPSVACYVGKPERYIHQRGIALWALINIKFRFGFNEKPDGSRLFDWDVTDLSLKLAKLNLQSADDYVARLEKADPPLGKRLKKEVGDVVAEAKKKGAALLGKMKEGLHKIGDGFHTIFKKLFS